MTQFSFWMIVTATTTNKVKEKFVHWFGGRFLIKKRKSYFRKCTISNSRNDIKQYWLTFRYQGEGY